MAQLELGMRAETSRCFSSEDLAEYAELAGDRVGGRVPEPLIGGLFSYLLGTRLPGTGTNYMKQRLTFYTGAHPGEELHASVEIIRLRPEKALVNLRTVCSGADGRLIADGEALVLVKDLVREV